MLKPAGANTDLGEDENVRKTGLKLFLKGKEEVIQIENTVDKQNSISLLFIDCF